MSNKLTFSLKNTFRRRLFQYKSTVIWQNQCQKLEKMVYRSKCDKNAHRANNSAPDIWGTSTMHVIRH